MGICFGKQNFNVPEPELQPWEKRGMLNIKKLVGWGNCYFYLSSNKLEYWDSKNACLLYGDGKRQDIIPLKGLSIEQVEKDGKSCYNFTTMPYKDTYILYHEDAAVMDSWIQQIKYDLLFYYKVS